MAQNEDVRRGSGTGEGAKSPAVLIGDAIRRARSGRFTVEQLAATAGVSMGSLSQIERGKGNPSFSTLQKIADALDLRIGDLVEASNPSPTGPMVVRRRDRARLQMGYDGLVYELITPNLRGSLEMLQTSIPPGFSNRSNPFQHQGEECVLVVEGEVTVGVGETTQQLTAGDAITYDPYQPHWWTNDRDVAATVVGAVTPPSF
ncbi:MAG: cupin domain-containing protein [Acidimicrobiia bacterium]